MHGLGIAHKAARTLPRRGGLGHAVKAFQRRVRQQRGDDLQKSQLVFQRGRVHGLVIHRERAHHLVMQPDGDAEERDPLALQVARTGPVEKERFRTRIAEAHGAAAGNDAAGDALPLKIAPAPPLRRIQPVRGIDADLAAARVHKRHRAVDEGQMRGHERERLLKAFRHVTVTVHQFDKLTQKRQLGGGRKCRRGGARNRLKIGHAAGYRRRGRQTRAAGANPAPGETTAGPGTTLPAPALTDEKALAAGSAGSVVKN